MVELELRASVVSYILISRSAQTLTCPRCLAITYLCKVTGGDVVDVVFVSDLAQSHRRAPVSGQFVTVRTKIQGPAGSDLGRCAMASRSTCSSFQFQPSNCAGHHWTSKWPPRKKTWATCQASLAPSARVPSTDPMSAAVRSGLRRRPSPVQNKEP